MTDGPERCASTTELELETPVEVDVAVLYWVFGVF